jgi:glycosyltransferase involved in cell wall biosynthesis
MWQGGRNRGRREERPCRARALAGKGEIILVDYGCPDGAGDWALANFAGVKVVHVGDDPGFCIGRARNLGAMQAEAEWLAFLDADTLVEDDWHGWMQRHLFPGQFYRRALVGEIRDAETHGVILCRRDDFLRVEGYDELYRGWGGEDEDLYQRLVVAGVSECEFPAELIRAISHGDEERAGWEGLASRQEMVDLCASYRLAKLQTLKLLGRTGELPLALRRQFMDHTRQNLASWFKGGRKTDLSMRYDVTMGENQIWFVIDLPADPAR